MNGLLKCSLVCSCLVLAGSFLAAQPRLFVPATIQARPGESVTIPVRVTGGEVLSNLQFRLSFDPQLLEYRSSLSGSSLPPGKLLSVDAEGLGQLKLVVSSYEPESLRPGLGTVAELVFRARREGSTALGLSSVVAAGVSGASVAVNLDDGQFEALAQKPYPVLVFPHYADGLSQGFYNKTRFILRNQGVDWVDTGRIVFRRKDGSELSSMPFAIDPRGSLDVQTPGTGPLESGAVEVYSDLGALSSLIGTQVFELYGRFVSVQAVEPSPTMQIYVSQDQRERAGVAVYNPDLERPLRIDMTLLREDGQGGTYGMLYLAPGEQVAQFLDEGIGIGYSLDEPFRGTINLFAQDGRPLVAVGLLQDRLTGGLVAVGGDTRAFR